MSIIIDTFKEEEMNRYRKFLKEDGYIFESATDVFSKMYYLKLIEIGLGKKIC
jgi:hypothetical protein